MVRKSPYLSVLPLPDQGKLVSPPGFYVPVDGVQHDIGLAADEPFVEGLLAVIQHLIPWSVPLKLSRPARPVPFKIVCRLFVDGFGIGHIGLSRKFGRRSIELTMELFYGGFGIAHMDIPSVDSGIEVAVNRT